MNKLEFSERKFRLEDPFGFYEGTFNFELNGHSLDILKVNLDGHTDFLDVLRENDGNTSGASMYLEELTKEFLIELRNKLYGEERVDTIMHSIERLMNGKPLNPSEMYTKRIEEQERKEYERLKRKFEPNNEKLDQ